MSGEGVCIERDQVTAFVERLMVAIGTKPSHAAILADNLMTADYRGIFSHGLNRLEMYSNDVKSGCTVSDKEPVILKESPATAYVDGNNILGPVVGTFCMDVAIKKAKEVGIGFVCVRGSNHYGIAGYYSIMASDQGMLGFSLTNTSPVLMPTRSRTACLGTNPISLAAPGKDGDSFVLDMATSAVAYGKVEMAALKNDKIPLGLGADDQGRVTNDPNLVLNGGALLPLGGEEITSGYKGYGLAMMVEILCGVLSGGDFGRKIKFFKTLDRPSNLSHCFIVINPDNFETGFCDRMQDLMDSCRNTDLAEGAEEVLVAGDPEKKHMEKCDRVGGIVYHPNVISELNKLADRLNVERIVTKKE